jgi:hypothetical protein
MVPPTGNCLGLVGESSGAFALHCGFVEIVRRVIEKDGFPADGRQFLLTAFLAFDFKRFLGCRQGSDRLIFLVEQRKSPRAFLAIGEIDPDSGTRRLRESRANVNSGR